MNKLRRSVAKLLIAAFIFTSVLAQYSTAFAAKSGTTQTPKNKLEILVKYKDNSKADTVKTRVKGKLKLNKLSLKKKHKRTNVELLEIDQTDDISKVVTELKSDPDVAYAQPNYKVSAISTPTDPRFDEQWGLLNDGQTFALQKGTEGMDIDAEEAWDTTMGSPSTVVGVLDTGIDINHPDLKNNIVTNKNEIPNNGIDDDGNGYVDDVHGWDFANDDSNVFVGSSEDQHGTHVAGIIAASANNEGIRGVAPNVKILPLKFIGSDGGYTSDAIDAIEYAKQMGVKVINCSFGGPDFNQALKDEMESSGILFVCAAGNSGKSVSEAPVYPASFDLPNVLSVAAVDNTGYLASFSNYGAKINVAAPGVGILSTMPNGEYGNLSGTSMAAPFATGIAALIQSKFPDLSANQIAARISNTVTPMANLKGKVSTGGIVNAYKALTNTTDEADNSSTTKKDNSKSSGKGNMVVTLAAAVSAALQEQIHYGEVGVNTATGNFSKSFTDLSVTAPGFTVNISRSYNSKDDRASSTMGRGWTFGFEGSLKDDTNNSNLKVAKLPNGGAQVFVKNSDGTYTANDSHSTLVKQADGTHILTTKDQYTYGFDTNGWLNWMKDRNGNTISINVNTSGQVQNIIDGAGRTYKVNYTGAYITSIIDPFHRKIIYTYDTVNNRLTQVSFPMNETSNSNTPQWSYDYDSSGYLIKISDNASIATDTISYDHANGHKVNKYTDIYQNVQSFNYDTTNSVTTITDSNNRVIKKWYDSAFYTTKSQDPEGKIATVTYNLDANSFNKYGEEKSITDRNGNTTTYDRDNNGNITKITNPDNSHSDYVYDDKNNLVSEFDETLKKDETGKATNYVYDSAKLRLLKKVQPLNGTDTYTADSEISKFAITSYTYYSDTEAADLGYKAKGLVKSETDPEGNTTSYTYDAQGNKKTITDPEGNVTTNTYNDIGWLTMSLSPRGFATRYDYDLAGRLIRTTLDKGETTRTVYDDMGRKLQEILPNQYDESKDEYPKDHSKFSYSDKAIGTIYTYYNYGKVKTVTDPNTNMTSYEYDIYGNMTKEIKPNGAVYLYEYDVMNRLTKTSFKKSITDTAVDILNQYSYTILSDKRSQKTETKYFTATDKAVTTYTFDFRNNLVEQLNPDNGLITIKYNANGTVNAKTDAIGGTTYYRYDGLNRQTETWTPMDSGKYSYSGITYDRAGRKTQEKVGKDKVDLYSVPVQDRLILKTYTYYADGNVKTVTDTSGKKAAYQYDNDGFMSQENDFSSKTESITTEYTNNQLGKVLTKTVHVKAGDLQSNDFDSTEDSPLTTTYDYDKNGNIVSITTPDNITTTFIYDNMNRQLSMTKPGINEEGKPVMVSTSTSYNREGKVDTTTDAKGYISKYGYNERDFLTTVKTQMTLKGTPTELTSAYAYDLAGRKTIEVSPLNYDSTKTLDQLNRTEYTYDKMDRVKLKTEKFNQLTIDQNTFKWVSNPVELVSKAYQYDKNGNVIKELDGEGYKAGVGSTPDEKINSGYGTIYRYSLANQVISTLDAVSKDKGLVSTTKTEYDGAGRKISETNGEGAVTGYTYDDAGNVISSSIRKSISDPEQILGTKQYDLLGNVISQTDGNGNTTTFQYNELGKVRKTVTPSDSTIPGNTITYQYDVMGNLAKKQDALGTVDLYTYDNDGRVLTTTEQDKDGKQSITNATSYDLNGNKVTEIDGNGAKTANSYDQLNHLIEVSITTKDTNGKATTHSTKYGYDANGNQTTQTDWIGNTYTNVYDPINRLIEKQTPYYGTQDPTYGTLKAVQRLEYNASHIQIASYDAKDNVTRFTYDKNNRLIATTDAEGHITRQDYDNVGRVASKTDGNGNTTNYDYDALGRLSKVINAKNEITAYTYDLNGNMLTQTDGKGNVTTFEYNAANKLAKRIDHGGRKGTLNQYLYDNAKVESYTYFANGNMATKTDRNGKTAVYAYDIHGRMLSQTIDKDVISYTYDNNGNQVSVTNSTGTTRRTFDEMGRVTTKYVTGMGTSTFQYDIFDTLDTQWGIDSASMGQGFYGEGTKDVKGNKTVKIFDKAGRLKYVIADGQKTTYNYDPNGNRASVVYWSGASEVYTYNKDNQNTQLINMLGSAEMENYSYTYDAAHNQLSKTEKFNGVDKGTTTNTYDELNRLASVKEPSGKLTEYTFDKAGNRETETVTKDGTSTVTTYAYNEQNRLMDTLQEVSGTKTITKYFYDNNGNMTKKNMEQIKQIDPGNPPQAKFGMFIYGQKDGATENAKPIVAGTASYEYDVWNQMVKAATADGTTVNKYNGEGYRVEKSVNGTITKYLYEADKVILETDGKGKQTAKNVYGINLLTRTTDGQILNYMYNGHADVTALIDVSGTVKAKYYYDAFGTPIAEGTSENGINNPIRYAGYQYDNETGLYYLNARMYDSKIARFMQEDDPQYGNNNDPLSLNQYTYCLNNPIIYLDPTGHEVTQWDRDHLTQSQLNQLAELTSDWDRANASGNANGKTTAHDAAEAIRNGARTSGEIGSASGYTYEINPGTNTATIYHSDAAIIVNNIVSGSIGNYIPAAEINTQTGKAIDIAIPDNLITQLKDSQNAEANSDNNILQFCSSTKDNERPTIKPNANGIPQKPGQITINGKQYQIFVPDFNSSGSNADLASGGWNSIKNYNYTHSSTELAQALGEVNLEELSDNFEAFGGRKLCKAAAALSFLEGVIKSLNANKVTINIQVTIQANGDENRAIIQFGMTNTVVKSEAGKSYYYSDLKTKTDANGVSNGGKLASNIVKEACGFTDDKKYDVLISLDAKHKKDPYFGYLSVNSDNQYVISPKLYSGDDEVVGYHSGLFNLGWTAITSLREDMQKSYVLSDEFVDPINSAFGSKVGFTPNK